MCGIAGVWSEAPVATVPLATRLDAALAHRGPDGHDAIGLDADRLLFVHRRLAIIDVSAAGRQPMSTADGRYTIVFNGEIYNHAELRRALEREGERFASESDTEVLLRLVARRGPAGLAVARGMFALAVWDARERTLLLARDRFGIKPLYVAATDGQIAFASEIRALIAGGLCARAIDPAGILGYLRWGSIPQPLTWVRGVCAVEPGTWLRWSSHRARECGRFADPRDLWRENPTATRSANELREQARDAVRDSVRAHLVADVPVGVFLSGGIDSTALVAAVATERRRLHTFTVTFSERSHSEDALAAMVAARFGCVHETLHVDPSRLLQEWPTIRDHLDQPTIDGVNAYFVSRAVAARGVKAVLSGVGADEVFGGYPSFLRVPRGVRLGSVPRAIRRAGACFAGAAASWRTHKLLHAATQAESRFELYRAVRGWIMPSELDAIAGPALRNTHAEERVNVVEEALDAPQAPTSIQNAVAQLETTIYMRHQLLRDTDVMSMAHGLEVRVPFVDHHLVQSIWPALGGHPDLLGRKRLLVEALQGAIPAAVHQRPKQGFTLPFEHWLDGPLREFVADGLSAAASDGWIDPAAPEGIRRAWRARRCHWSRPWGLAVLGHFLRHV